MRARNIKPSFFTNELLGSLDPIISLLFAGLWCLADKNGILEDRVLRIKAEIFPYRENTDVNGYLTVLEREEFISRYKVDDIAYIEVLNFTKHQAPHHTEKSKGFPSNPLKLNNNGVITVKPPLENVKLTVAARSDSLIPDSLIPDSKSEASPRKRGKKPKTDLPEAFKISEGVRSWAKEKGHSNLDAHFESFIAKVKANGYQYADWDSAFQEAVRGNWAKIQTVPANSSGDTIPDWMRVAK